MREIIMASWLVICMFVQEPVEPVKKAALNNSQTGDKYYAMSNGIKDSKAALANIDKAIAAYKIDMETNTSVPLPMVKYAKASDFKYRYLTGTPAQKKAIYEGLIKKIEPMGKKWSGTKEYNYTMALLWGRRGELTQDVMDNDNKAIAEKIKKYGETLYKMDKTYEGYFAGKLLGRINYIAPNIPFILSWPDKNKSKKYLEEVVKGDPGNTEGRMFLADTLWEIGDKKIARKMYAQVVNSVPRKADWYYDTRQIKVCSARMKKLDIK